MESLVSLVTVIVLSVVAVAPHTLADTTVTSDPNDSPGRFDVKSVSHGHTRNGLLTHKVTMWNTWNNGALRGDANQIRVSFNTDSDRVKEREMIIDLWRGSLFAEMRCYCNQRDVVVGFAKVWRPDESSIKVAFPRRLLRKRLSTYRWRVSTHYAKPWHTICRIGDGVQSVCRDYAPDRGYIRHG